MQTESPKPEGSGLFQFRLELHGSNEVGKDYGCMILKE